MVPNSACLLPTLVTGDLIDFDIVFTSFGGEQSLPVQEKKTVSFVTVKGAIDTVFIIVYIVKQGSSASSSSGKHAFS